MIRLLQLTGLVLLAFTITTSSALAGSGEHQFLPPGLQKKLYRGGSLPPGWQKKIVRGAVLDEEIYRRARILTPIDPYGAVTLRVENRVFRIMYATRVILDILR